MQVNDVLRLDQRRQIVGCLMAEIAAFGAPMGGWRRTDCLSRPSYLWIGSFTFNLCAPPGTAVVNQARLKLGMALRASILTSAAIVACALRLLGVPNRGAAVKGGFYRNRRYRFS